MKNETKTSGHKARKDAIMRNLVTAAMFAAITIASIGCKGPGGDAYDPAFSAALSLNELCGVDVDTDADLPAVCTDGLNATMALRVKSGTDSGGYDTFTEYTCTFTDNGDGTYSCLFADLDAGNYVHSFTGIPEKCSVVMTDGSVIPSPINVADLPADSVENSMGFKLICDGSGGDTIIIPDGGIDWEEECAYEAAEIFVTCFDADELADEGDSATPMACTVELGGPIAFYEATFEDFEAICVTTDENPTCTFTCLKPVYHSVTITAEGYEGVIWDNNTNDLEAAKAYPLQVPLSLEMTHPENSLVDFPGFNMANGSTMECAGMYFAHYDADDNQVPISASEATYQVLSGTSVVVTGGEVDTDTDVDGGTDGGVDDVVTGDVAVLEAVSAGSQTTIQRCWTGHPSGEECQTFVVTTY